MILDLYWDSISKQNEFTNKKSTEWGWIIVIYNSLNFKLDEVLDVGSSLKYFSYLLFEVSIFFSIDQYDTCISIALSMKIIFNNTKDIIELILYLIHFWYLSLGKYFFHIFQLIGNSIIKINIIGKFNSQFEK